MADRQRQIKIGFLALGTGHELMLRGAGHRLEHAGVADSVADHFDHQLALCFE